MDLIDTARWAANRRKAQREEKTRREQSEKECPTVYDRDKLGTDMGIAFSQD